MDPLMATEFKQALVAEKVNLRRWRHGGLDPAIMASSGMEI